MLRKIFKEISRFILSVFICILGCYIFVNFFCGDFHLSTSSCPNGVFCVIREHALFCNIRVPSMIFLGITFLIELLLVWYKKISKGWIIDLIIILLLWFTASVIVEYAMSPY